MLIASNWGVNLVTSGSADGADNIGRVLSHGFGVWKNNTNICIPYVLASISVFSLLLLLLYLMLYTGVEGITLSGSSFSLEQYISINMGTTILLLAGGSIILLVIIILIESFFIGGAIGMAKTTMDTGHTAINDMVTNGRRSIFNIFLADIAIGFIMSLGAVFVIPGYVAMTNLVNANPNLTGMVGSATSPYIMPNMFSAVLGLLVWLIYMMIISLVLVMTNYVIVVDRTGPLEGVRRAFGFFMCNKGEVTVVWLIIISAYAVLYVMTALFAYVPYLAPVLLALNFAISIVIVEPLGAVWWTDLYLSRSRGSLYDDVGVQP